ncbi:UAA transporter family [Musa troglodytarum]|uniref:UAA transporter family n=2 Tax=Musa troglodytarum TaxID=320322 RepID=A0A9E7L275_9LILI|nr:UAA transporter family [Musa troglodytarum]
MGRRGENRRGRRREEKREQETVGDGRKTRRKEEKRRDRGTEREEGRSQEEKERGGEYIEGDVGDGRRREGNSKDEREREKIVPAGSGSPAMQAAAEKGRLGLKATKKTRPILLTLLPTNPSISPQIRSLLPLIRNPSAATATIDLSAAANRREFAEIGLGLPRRRRRRRMSTKGNWSPPAVSGRLFTFGLVASWYSSNIGVLLLNKYLLSNYGFKYPIFLTMCHMAACSLLSYVAIAWLRVVPMQTVRSRLQFLKIATLSLVFCGSVVSGNVSLKYLPVSFNQAVGATTPFFTAVFAYLMTVKREAWITYITLIPVVTGVIIASGGEPSFHLFGFIMCVGATAARALKSVLQGILLSSEGEKLNSMNLLLYMAPTAVVLLLPATLIMEENVVGITMALAREDFKIIWYLLFNSTLAYFVNLTNFLVTKHTSALTLQVLGNAKGAVAVVVSILIFKNPVTVTGMLGYTVTVIGVILYSEAKKRSK